jgi:hypothetical protein
MPEALCNISQQAVFYGEKLLAPRPTPKLKDRPLLVVRNCLPFISRGRFVHPQPEDALYHDDSTNIT